MLGMHANKVQPHRFSRCGLCQAQLVMYVRAELSLCNYRVFTPGGCAGVLFSPLREPMLYTLRHYAAILLAD